MALAGVPIAGISSGRPAAHAAPRPNILIIVTDDQRPDAMGTMPHTRQLFGAEGTEFTNTYDTTPLCCPSRASIFTGMYMHNHHVTANAGDAVNNLDQRKTIQYALHRAGYTTAIFGKYFNPWPLNVRPPYFDKWALTNFNYYGAKFNVEGKPRTVSRYTTDFVSDKAVNFLHSVDHSTHPWFLYVAPTAPHAPFTPEKSYAHERVSSWNGNPATDEADISDKPPWVRDQHVSLDQARTTRRQQLRTLSSVDDMVGRMMRVINEMGEDRDTLAFFMSDNGFLWGEHHAGDKRLPYVPSLQVPLYVRWPGHVGAQRADPRMAANIDVPATVFDATGLTPNHSLDGHSLLQTWDRDRLLVEYGRDDPPWDEIPSWAGELTRNLEYVEYYDDDGTVIFREYYDLQQDPWELDNTLHDRDPSNDPSPVVLERESNQLKADRSCNGSSCP